MAPAFRSRHHLLSPVPLRIITNQSVVLRVNIFRRLSLKSTAGVSSGAADESPFSEYTKILQATSRSGFCKHRWIRFYSCRCDKISQERHFKGERLILVQSWKVQSALVWERCRRELEAVGCAVSTVSYPCIHIRWLSMLPSLCCAVQDTSPVLPWPFSSPLTSSGKAPPRLAQRLNWSKSSLTSGPGGPDSLLISDPAEMKTNANHHNHVLFGSEIWFCHWEYSG